MNVIKPPGPARTLVFVLLAMLVAMPSASQALRGREVLVLGMSEGRAKVQVDGKWGFIDRSGRLVIPARFEQAYDFRHGLASVVLEGQRRTIDPAGRLVEEPPLVMPDGGPFMPFVVFDPPVGDERPVDRWGFRDSSGRVVVPPKHAWTGGFHEGLAGFRGVHTRRDQFSGFLDYRGGVAVELDVFYASRFSEGKVAALFHDGRYRFLDRSGKPAFEGDYRSAFDFSEGVAAVDTHPDPQPSGINRVSNGRWRFIDHGGKPAFAETFDQARPFRHGVAPVMVNHRWGLLDRTGRLIVPARYRDVQYPDANGLILVRLEGSPARFAFLNLRGETVIGPIEGHAHGFSEGLCGFWVFDPDSRTTRAGYLSLSGEVVIPAHFKQVEAFREGVARVHTDAGAGYIRADGSWLWELSR